MDFKEWKGRLLNTLLCGFLLKKSDFPATVELENKRLVLQKCEKTVISKQRLLADQSDTWPFLLFSR